MLRGRTYIWGGFPKFRVPILGRPHNKDYCVLGSIMGSPSLAKLPYVYLHLYYARYYEHIAPRNDAPHIMHSPALVMKPKHTPRHGGLKTLLAMYPCDNLLDPQTQALMPKA